MGMYKEGMTYQFRDFGEKGAVREAFRKARDVCSIYGLNPAAHLRYWSRDQVKVLEGYMRSDGEITQCDLLIGMNSASADMIRTT